MENNWIEIKIKTLTEGIDILTGKLTDLGIDGFVIEDKEDFKEFLQSKEGHWDYIDENLMSEMSECDTHVTFYLEDNDSGKKELEQVKQGLAELLNSENSSILGKLSIEVNGIKQEDWANNWKQYFKPFCVGKKLLVKPSWEDVPKGEENRTILEIDPESSFGTGQHYTTRLCLEFIEKYLNKGDRVLDLGCGSGILGIGSMLLEASECKSVDIEENAMRIAGQNFEKNNIANNKYEVFCGDIISDEKLCEKLGNGYDLICANIVADVLIAMSGIFGRFLKSGGLLMVSGIIDERAEQVVSAITEKGFEVIEKKQDGGWTACVLRLI